MALIVQEGIISLCQWPERLINISFARKSAITFCSFIVIIILAKGLVSSFNEDERERHARHQSLALVHAVIGQWFHQHASPNETIAAIPIGAVSYYSELNSIDRLGITDIHIAHTKMPQMGRGIPGHEKHDFGYMLSKKPTYYLPPAPENSKYKPPKSEIKKFHQLYKLFYTNEPTFKFFYKLKKNHNDV